MQGHFLAMLAELLDFQARGCILLVLPSSVIYIVANSALQIYQIIL